MYVNNIQSAIGDLNSQILVTHWARVCNSLLYVIFYYMKLCNILVSTCCAWSWKNHFENLKSNLESFEEKHEQHPKGMKVPILSKNKPKVFKNVALLAYFQISRYPPFFLFFWTDQTPAKNLKSFRHLSNTAAPATGVTCSKSFSLWSCKFQSVNLIFNFNYTLACN